MTWRKPLIALIALTVAALACTFGGDEVLPTPIPTPTRRAPRLATPVPQPVIVATPTPLSEDVLADADAVDALLINLYRRANPAVVFIAVLAAQEGTLVPLGSGSGFVIDDTGYIVTNNHVVEQAEVVRVTFSDGTITDAEILGQDPYSDLAVIRVDLPADRLATLEFGDSSALQVGQRVIAIGNPFGLEGTMTVGIVSALGRTLPSQVAEAAGFFSNPEIIQTDAAINPGNSGGPLLDSNGHVVGVNSAIRSATGENSGIGFAVPVNTVMRIVPALIEEGFYRYPYLGITSNSFFSLAELADALDLPVTRGVLIATVTAGEPAASAGLRGGNRDVEVLGAPVRAGGDIIVAVDGYELHDFDDLIAYLVRETVVGQEVEMTIVRDGESLEIPVVLGERP